MMQASVMWDTCNKSLGREHTIGPRAGVENWALLEADAEKELCMHRVCWRVTPLMYGGRKPDWTRRSGRPSCQPSRLCQCKVSEPIRGVRPMVTAVPCGTTTMQGHWLGSVLRAWSWVPPPHSSMRSFPCEPQDWCINTPAPPTPQVGELQGIFYTISQNFLRMLCSRGSWLNAFLSLNHFSTSFAASPN